MIYKALFVVQLLFVVSYANESCDNTTEVATRSLSHTFSTLVNVSDVTQYIMNTVMESIHCDDDDCRCLNSSMILNTNSNDLNDEQTDKLFTLLLRYLDDAEETCESLRLYGDLTLTPQFNLGFFASNKAESVIQNVIANIVHSSQHDDDDSGSHSDESHSDEDGDESHEDGEHDHDDDSEHNHSNEESDNDDESEPNNDGLAQSQEDDDSHNHEHSQEEDEHSSHESHNSDEDHSGENKKYYELINGCPHIECLDTVVMIRLLNELGVYSNDQRLRLFTTLLIEHIIADKPIAVDCGSDIDIDDLPTAEDIIQDMFSQVGAASEQQLTFTEFEALVDELGLGPDQHDDDEDHSSHDEGGVHDHRRRKREVTQCLSASELYGVYGFPQSLNLSGEAFSMICPSLVQQIISGSCLESDEHDEDDVTDAQKYGYGTLAVLIICVAALPGIFMYPIVAKRNLCYRLLMAYMIGLAIGSLLGDALLHLLPEAFGLHEHDHAHDEESGPVFEDVTKKALLALAAAIAFFILESIMNSFVRGNKKMDNDQEILHNKKYVAEAEKGKTFDEEPSKPETSFIKRVKPMAWMVIIGDSLHNFVDGLAIGAAFSDSVAGGISTSIAVFCHELPHELGDFAVLVNSGFSVAQAAMVNFFSACVCFAGLYLGIAISVDENTRLWIFTVTGGMFLYVSLSDMIPEAHELQSGTNSLLVLILELLGIFTGAGILLLLAVYESAILNSV